jgi:cephalosporin hydroxylase
MNLEQALQQLCVDYQLSDAAVRQYASEDVQSGWNGDRGTWPPGAIWTVEGVILYVLLRVIKPDTAVELGVQNWGASTVHMAAALKANRRGVLLGIDTNGGTGILLDGGLGPHVEMKVADGIEFLEATPAVDFIFEDMDHSYETCKRVAELVQTKLKVGGYLVVHDAEHPLWTVGVKTGLEDGGITPTYYLIEPSDCGIAVWRRDE